MENFLLGLFEFLAVLLVVGFFVVKKLKRKMCFKCRRKYTPEDLTMVSSDLKWERKEKQQEKTTRGGFAVTGGADYIEITKYKVYYRIISFSLKCKNCGRVHSLTKRFDLYDGSSNHSQTQEEQIALLKRKVKNFMGKDFFDNQKIKIKNIDY